MLACPGAVQFLAVSYKFVALDRLQITRVIDVTEAVRALRESAALDAELALLKTLGKPPARRPRASSVAGPRSSGKRRHDEACSVGPGSGGIVDDAHGENSGAEDWGDGVDLDLVDDDVQAAWEIREEWAGAAADAVAEEVEEEGLPIVVTSAGGHSVAKTYMRADEPSRRLARQTVMKPGTKQEAFSIYCNLHGCAKCLKPHSFPDELAVRRWLKAGMSLPAGRAGREAHMKAFPR